MKKIESMITKMVAAILETELDVKKFDRGNQRAGIRVRKAMQKVRALAQQIRSEIQTIKKYRKNNAKKFDS